VLRLLLSDHLRSHCSRSSCALAPLQFILLPACLPRFYSTLHGNRLTGTLPLEWGLPGAFTVLKQLTLSDNVGLVGTLPAAWGASNDSLPLLEDFNVSRTGLSGRLPEWGPYPTNLRAL
jgi:hypothetical protein